MDVIISGVNLPGHYAPKVNSTTQITLFEVKLAADVRVTPANLKAGDLCRVRFVQDATGGHSVSWGTPPSYEGTAPTIAGGAGAITEVVLTVQSATVVEYGSFSGGSGGAGVATLTAGENILLTGTATDPIVNTVDNPDFATSLTLGTLVSVPPTFLVMDGSSPVWLGSPAANILSASLPIAIDSTASHIYIRARAGFTVYAWSDNFQMLARTGGASRTVSPGALCLDAYSAGVGAETVSGSGFRSSLEGIAKGCLPTSSATSTGAISLSLKTSNAFELTTPLTGNVVVTFTGTPDLDTTPHAQDFTLRYAPNGHHATFGGSASMPLAPADLNAAALSTAETTANFITMWWHCATDGRMTCTWVAN